MKTKYRQKRKGIVLVRVTLDDELLEEARQLGKHHAAKDAAIAALKEYVAFHRREVSEDSKSRLDQNLPHQRH